jgi:hypothetical protein
MVDAVTLHRRTTPYDLEDLEGFVFTGNKIIGEVRRGDHILHTVEVNTDDGIESVCDAQDQVDRQIEDWAVENTDYVPKEDL